MVHCVTLSVECRVWIKADQMMNKVKYGIQKAQCSACLMNMNHNSKKVLKNFDRFA